jgi:hypothetical protein
VQVLSPQKGPRTGIDGLLRESEPDGFTKARTSPTSIAVLTVTQPPSADELLEDLEKRASQVVNMLRGQRPHLNLDWLEKVRDSASRLFKLMDDNIRDETRRTLPKTNERDRRNQPLPANIIGRHFGTFTRHNSTGQ